MSKKICEKCGEEFDILDSIKDRVRYCSEKCRCNVSFDDSKLIKEQNENERKTLIELAKKVKER